MSFADKVVIVTGASSGIGAATAVLFSTQGANVVLVGRNETKLNNVAKKCEQNGPKPLIVKADVSKDEDAKNLVQKTTEKYSKIDVLVNNAGMAVSFGSILDGKLFEVYDEVMNVNLRSAVHLTALTAPYLVETKGNIVNVSSVGSTHTPLTPEFISYCVSKAGLDHFTKSAALELSSKGVRVNAVRPGPVRTDLIENGGMSGTWDEFKATTALNRVSEPEELAEMILFLAGDKAKGVTGSIFTSDNGFLLKN